VAFEPIAGRPTAVVIGNHTQGLGIVRSAGTAGWATWVVNDHVVSLARFSRYLSGYRLLRRGTLTDLDNPAAVEELCRTLLDLPVSTGSVLFGVNEDITRFIFCNRERLSVKYHIPNVALDQIYDKYRFNNLLPETARIDTRLFAEGDRDIADPDRFIVKGRQGNAFRRITGAKAMPLLEFKERYAASVCRELGASEILVQRLVTSDRPVLSVCAFSVDGQVQSSFQYEKLRQHPNQFGTGTYLRSTAVDGVRATAGEVLRRMAFTGISELEFIHDSESGGYKIIEMNPRTWKSTHFAAQCGANLVDAYLTYAASGECPSGSAHAVDRYWVDLATDIPQLIRSRQFGPYHVGFHECSWTSSDPLPGLALWTLFPVIAIEHLWTVLCAAHMRRAAGVRQSEVAR
jgi:predicted ATP-grasp superfamily ATP-dependent carboligase